MSFLFDSRSYILRALFQGAWSEDCWRKKKKTEPKTRTGGEKCYTSDRREVYLFQFSNTMTFIALTLQ